MTVRRFTIIGEPVTKKNGMQMARTKTGRWFPVQSAKFKSWEKSALKQLPQPKDPIFTGPVEVRAKFYRTNRRADLVNLFQALGDVLQKAGIVKNDKLIESWDGSRQMLDKDRPRAEIEIHPLRSSSL